MPLLSVSFTYEMETDEEEERRPEAEVCDGGRKRLMCGMVREFSIVNLVKTQVDRQLSCEEEGRDNQEQKAARGTRGNPLITFLAGRECGEVDKVGG